MPFPTPRFLCAECIEQIMTEAGTADRGSGLGHIPAQRLALSQKIAECLLSVIEQAAATERQTVSQSTSASECVKRPMSSKLQLPVFFSHPSVTKIRSKSLTSFLALPRHQLQRLLIHLHSPGVLDLKVPVVVLPPQDVLQAEINPKSPPLLFSFPTPHLILAWRRVLDLSPTDLLMVGERCVALPTDLRHPDVCRGSRRLKVRFHFSTFTLCHYPVLAESR